MKRTKLISLFLAVLMLLSAVVPVSAASAGLQNFKPAAEYTGFSDVASNVWYADNVKVVCEYGLMNGTGDGKFNPNGYITMLETVVLASRLHDIYHGGDGVFEQSDPWYKVYDDYAWEHNLSAAGFADNADFAISMPTRELFITFIADAIPASEFKQINDVCSTEITGNDTVDCIQRLFNAGVITGKSDGTGFAGGSVITRAEAAAVLTRMIIPSMRVQGRPLFILDTASSVVPALYLKSQCKPGDRCQLVDNTFLKLNADYSIIATNNGIKYDAVIDEETARNDPEWNYYSEKYLKISSSTSSCNQFSSSQSSSSTSSTSSSSTSSSYTSPANTYNYVLNTSTYVFHYSWCGSVKLMKESNKKYYNGSRAGIPSYYRACEKCNP